LRSLFTAALMATTAFPAVVLAQEVASPPINSTSEIQDDDFDDEEIVVIAGSIRGQVNVPQAAVQVFDEEDIASYGAASIDELLASIAPQTGSGRGRGEGHPVMLLNGQRISSFREMRSIPPEAIRRMEVLPEEVALRFGYPPNQRVVNIILKDNFSSVTAAGEFNVPTRGGYSNYEAETSLFKIAGPNRINVEAKIDETSLLTESERGIAQEAGDVPTVAGDPDPALFRSLTAASREITLNGTLARGLGEEGLDGQLTGNLAYTRTDTRSLSGINLVTLTDPNGDSAIRSLSDPLARRVGGDRFEAGLGYNKPLGDWQLSVTLDAAHADTITRVDRRLTQAQAQDLQDAALDGTLDIAGPLPDLASPGVDRGRTRSLTASSLATLTGRAFMLPAGDATLTVRGGYDFERSINTDTRTAMGDVTLKRGDLSGGANLALPITSRKENVLGAIGDLTLNFSGGVNHLSDFGTLTDMTAGLTWSPTEKLTFQASYIVNEAAPSLSQLGAPTITTFNVSTYDFTRGETALVTVTSGGNPGLVAEKQRDIKLSATWHLPFLERSNLIVEYFRNRSTDVTQGFPLLTPAVEAAFPDRVTRAANGRLIAIDQRPVTFDEVSGSRLRWGFNLSGSLGESSGGEAGGGAARSMARAAEVAPAPAATPAPIPADGTRHGFDPARFAALREQLCTPAAAQTEPDLAQLPERMRARLAGPDGKIDPAKLVALRERMCSAEAVPPASPLAGQAEPTPRTPPVAAGPGMGGPGGRGRGSRWNLSVYHTMRFTDRVTIAAGGPVLDQLDGDAISSGGVPRHAIEFEGGLFRNGYGLRLNGTWNAPAKVNGSGLPGSSDLRFGSTFVVDARMFVDLGQQENLVEKVPFLKGSRLAFTVDNLLDSRQKVTDENGQIPFAYQRAYREPQGRVIGIDFRKMF